MAGANVQAGATAAENEALNNQAAPGHYGGLVPSTGTAQALTIQNNLDAADSYSNSQALGYGSTALNLAVTGLAFTQAPLLYLRPPDAMQIQVGGYPLAPVYSYNMLNGEDFIGGSINRPISASNPLKPGFSVSYYWLAQLQAPTAPRVTNYLNGFSYGTSGAIRIPVGEEPIIGVGPAVGYSPGNGLAFGISIGSPGISYSPFSYSVPLGGKGDISVPTVGGPL